jgi:hypothetical protein
MKRSEPYLFRSVILVICLIVVSLAGNAQKVKISKGKIMIDEKVVFNYKEGNNDISLYNINTNEEVIYIKKFPGKITEGPDQYSDDYVSYLFIKEKIKVEIGTPKYDLGLLYNQGVFDLEGNLNPDKIMLFKEKYDENISGRTIIVK